MTTRTLSGLSADVDRNDRTGAKAATGLVKLYAVPQWLKSAQLATASLTPKQARRLAVELLQAADRAEENQP
jgi:hypothetical protein